MIAQTETTTARAQAQARLWQEAERTGVLPVGEFEREWVSLLIPGVTDEDCWQLHGQRAPIGGAYPDGTVSPPVHPGCFCAEKLVRVGAAAANVPAFVMPEAGESLRPAEA